MRAWALVVVIAAGCGGGGGGGGSPVKLADVPARSLDGICDFAVRCHGFPDIATCKSVSFSNASQEVASVNAGKATYDENLAGDCLSIFFDLSCSRAGLLDDLNTAACRDTFQGTVVLGGACFDDIECAGHGNCKFPTGCDSNTMCCIGTCEANDTGAIGQACGKVGDPCVAGAYCKVTGTTGTCTARLTTAGAACDLSDACAAPLACVRMQGATTGGTCVKLPGEGETCDPMVSPNCDLIFDACDPTAKKCTRLPGLGQTCTDACLGDTECTGGTCVARGTLGAPCGMTNQPDCSGSLECTNDHCAVPTAKPICM